MNKDFLDERGPLEDLFSECPISKRLSNRVTLISVHLRFVFWAAEGLIRSDLLRLQVMQDLAHRVELAHILL